MIDPNVHSEGLTANVQSGGRPTEWTAQETLDALVTRVATRLMDTAADTMKEALTGSLREIAQFFSMDTAFLRSNDHEAGLSILDAEWPVRVGVPDPDPLGEVPFEADPVFGATRYLTEPYVIRQAPPSDGYQARIKTGSGIDGVSMAMVPLMRNGETTGVLGFIKCGDREWATRELNALQAIASLIVQLQGRISAEERLKFHAYHDELTGVLNRRALIERLDERLANQHGTLSLFFFGLDRFKSVNGFFGQAAGDELLRVIAKRMQDLARASDLVARLGGDEFIMVLENLGDRETTTVVVNRILDELRQPVTIGENQTVRTASAGVAASEPDMRSSQDLLSNADVALRQAKANGGDQACFFDRALRETENERASIEIGLRRAIDQNELVLHYQPELDINTGKLLGVEALVRWQHPERGLLSAGMFIGVAEETGLVVDLGRWVINEAVRQMAEWRRTLADSDFTIRVNLSPAQLSTVNTVGFVASLLERHELPGHLLCFEITEHALMQNPLQSIQQLNALRMLGISMAIDDFGTGYSSMTQLKNLPLDILKIDQTFVAGLGESAGDQAIIEASIQLARSFNLEVVAEGIETAEQLSRLRMLGCVRGQGYLLRRPASPDDLAQLMANGGIDLGDIERTPTAA